jgi:hypothetical protein
MRKVFVLLAAAALPVGTGALAGDMSYNYLQADLQGAELSGYFGIISGAGVAVHGSAGIGPWAYAFGDYSNTKYAGNGLKVRFLTGRFGLGGHVSLSSTIDIFGGASVERLKIRTGIVGFPTEDDSETFNGWGVNLGSRGWLGESFQWTFIVNHRDFQDLSSIYSIALGGRYYIRRAWSVGMDYTYQKYDNKILFGRDSLGSLNVRYTIGGY